VLKQQGVHLHSSSLPRIIRCSLPGSDMVLPDDCVHSCMPLLQGPWRTYAALLGVLATIHAAGFKEIMCAKLDHWMWCDDIFNIILNFIDWAPTFPCMGAICTFLQPSMHPDQGNLAICLHSQSPNKTYWLPWFWAYPAYWYPYLLPCLCLMSCSLWSRLLWEVRVLSGSCEHEKLPWALFVQLGIH